MSSPSNAHPELEAEQRHVDAAYERLDAMRRSAVAVAAAYSEVQRGGTHQARLERDVAIETTRRRLAALDIGDAALCFGRLDLESGDRCYVGRIGVDDEEHTPLVVDWRAPVAEPFYRATAVEPLGVVRRRHFQTRGRRILGLDDEVFDREEADRSGLTLVGEGALLAALERVRTGRMADIVATIQAEQDEAIRADLQGPLVVTGGPGTGKTAVALHRAAYLLYTHRRRLGAQGVLLVGPSPVFLRYIDEVLPSLGESDVVLSTLAGLKPGYRVRGAEPDAVAATKGDARMAKVIAKALADRERALPRDVSFVLDGHRLHLTRRESARIAERARRRRGTHNARRPLVARMVLDHLVAQYRRAIVRAYRAGAPDAAGDRLLRSEELARDELAVAAALARGEPAPPEWEQELRVRLRRLPEVREALERMWPVLTGAELVHDLLGFVALIRSAADGTLDRREQLGLHRERSGDVAEVSWTDADLPLIDEADALVGSPSEARSRRRRRTRVEAATHEQAARVIDELGLRGFARVADVLDRYGSDEPAEARADGAEPRRFGHVIVDEAQDLTAMQWRMLARRCPSGSMTLVGDPGQAGRPGALATWEEVLAQLPRLHTPRIVHLSVNYRTPAEIMAVADLVLAAAAPGVERSRAVRSTGVDPCFERTDPTDVVGAAATRAREAVRGEGTVALVAPEPLHRELVEALADVGAVAGTAEAIDAPVAVLAALDVKGLEFDHVVVVEPARLAPPTAAGLRTLYMVLTRATQRLSVVFSAPLPEALAPPLAATPGAGPRGGTDPA